jgi:membrane-associated phospholipid phosphatase
MVMIDRTECVRIQYRVISSAVLLLVATVVMAMPVSSEAAEEFLTTGEVVAITGGAVATAGLGQLLKNIDSTRTPLIKGPLPLESSLQRWLGGKCGEGKRNFLDDRSGSMFTPAAAGLVLLSSNLAWPRADQGREAAQDMFLFGMGLFTTKGITGLAKSIVARPRPLLCLEPDLAAGREVAKYSYDHSSFFSGHTSGAFFSCAFLNLRLRAIMRSELHDSEYRNYRWAPPTLLFGWATFVGWSRIHAYKHYVSDVVVGAAVGTLMAELFYSFADDYDQSSGADNPAPMLIFYSYSF